MRTTFDVDDELFQKAARKFPPGTSKRVVVNEALRGFVGETELSAPVLGTLSHIPLHLHEDFDDPIPGFGP